MRGARFGSLSLLMVYKYGSDVRAHATVCFVNPPYGSIVNLVGAIRESPVCEKLGGD